MRIEAERVALGISTGVVAARAGVAERAYRRAVRAEVETRPATIVRLEQALAALQAERRAAVPDTLLIRATYGGFVLALATREGVDPAAVHAQDPRKGATADRAWRQLAQVRQAAIYLTNVALGVRQSRLALALELTPAAICLALRSVELRREDPDYDAALGRIGDAVAAALPGNAP